MAARGVSQVCYDVWATAWGPMGAAVGPEGVTRLVLPHGRPEQGDQVREILAGDCPGAVEDGSPLARLRDVTQAYFEGCRVDFRDIPCALPPANCFAGKVLWACHELVYGQTEGYSTLAERVGSPRAARAVASALGRNPIPLIVPCHRVTYVDGRLGGFSAAGGVDLKRRMLALEGVAAGA